MHPQRKERKQIPQGVDDIIDNLHQLLNFRGKDRNFVAITQIFWQKLARLDRIMSSCNMYKIRFTPYRKELGTIMSRQTKGHGLISLDGRSQSYPDNIHLRIRKAPYSVKVVTRQGQSFFSTLRKKMMWGADSRG